MSVNHIKSKAFERAALKSESYRIIGIICLLGALTIYSFVRSVSVGHMELLLMQTLLLFTAIGYEVFMLSVVKKAIREEKDVPYALWVANIFIESQIPTLALFLLIRSELMNPYLLLVGPTMFAYVFFIILSALRLNPALSVLTGLLSAIGYFGIALYTVTTYPASETNPITFPIYVYLIYASLILASSFIAAFVAGQIQIHVMAALREAELESELEQVRHDLDVARSIQQSLLPSTPPGLEHFELAGWNQPADQTGGDYFDWQTLPDGTLAVSLADATGHGIGPALVSTSCRAYARASFLIGGEHDDGLLDHLNKLLSEDLESNRFVTFATVLLNPESSHIKVLSAGHGPILWYRSATRTIENLEAQGIPLGMIAGIQYGQGIEGTLEKGDFIALMTDGFYEWANAKDEEFGVHRLEEVLQLAHASSAEEMITSLRSAVEDFCQGTEQLDDLTVVILKRKAEPAKIKKRVGSLTINPSNGHRRRGKQINSRSTI
jgi:serine phosphatase RsbU (regulator of sigma subunit)